MFEENKKFMVAIQNEQEEEGIDWRALLDLVLANKFWIALSAFLAVALGLVYLRHTPKMYSSTTTFIVKDDKKGGNMSGISSEIADLGLMSTKSNVEDELEAMKSPYLMYMVVKQMKLDVAYTKKQFLKSTDLYKLTPVVAQLSQATDDDAYSFTVTMVDSANFQLNKFTFVNEETKKEVIIDSMVLAKPGQAVSTPIGMVQLAYTENFDAEEMAGEDIVISKVDAYKLAMGMVKNLTAELVSKKGNVVNLGITETSADKATDVLNNLLDIYVREGIEDKRQTASITSKFIEGRLLIIEEELGGIDNDIERYKSKELLTNVAVAGTSYMAENTTYSAKALEANNQLNIAKFIKNCLTTETEKPTMLPANAGLTDQGVSSLISEYNGMVMKYDRLMANSSEKNPLVVELKNQMSSLRVSINSTLDNLIQTYEMTVESLRGKESQIQQKLASNPKQEKYLLSIGRQQKIKESLYLYLLQKREENELSGNLQVSNIRMLTPPRGESIPVSPKGKQVLLIALILGMALPIGIILLIDSLDATVRGKKDLQNISLPYLGDIPLCGKIEDKSKHALPVKIVVKEKKRDQSNEAFRVLRSNLNFMTANNNDRVMMFTSYFPNSGKTFVCANLALGIALTGKKVIVIDADMRKAELSKQFCNKHQGLSSYLSGQTSDLKKLVCKSELNDNLFFLPCGTMPPNPSELLLTDKLDQVIEKLKEEYDYIFIDCTPLNIVADAAIVGKKADLVLFVIRQGKFIRAALPELDTLYKSQTFKQMATILNATYDSGNYGGYGRYGNYGGYGSYGYGTYGYGNMTDEDDD